MKKGQNSKRGEARWKVLNVRQESQRPERNCFSYKLHTAFYLRALHFLFCLVAARAPRSLTAQRRGDRGSSTVQRMLLASVLYCFSLHSQICKKTPQGRNLFSFRQVMYPPVWLKPARTNTKPHMDFGGVIFSLIINRFEAIYAPWLGGGIWEERNRYGPLPDEGNADLINQRDVRGPEGAWG